MVSLFCVQKLCTKISGKHLDFGNLYYQSGKEKTR